MSNLKSQIEKVSSDLLTMLTRLSDEEYALKLDTLSGHSIGSHCRHILEFMLCLTDGFKNGMVCYDKRNRDTELETNRQLFISRYKAILELLVSINPVTPAQLQVLATSSNAAFSIDTTFGRELYYNIEHTIHHMAIIRIAIQQHFNHVLLDTGFGVAFSTINYKNECAQ